MSKEVRDCKIPGGKGGRPRTFGDLLDRTPKNMMSRIMLDEKVFDTWYSVLLGDGEILLFVNSQGILKKYSSLVSSAGQGGVAAMYDAVSLANWIATLQALSLSELDTVFLVPSSGQGGDSAMHDAVALANWIATLQSVSMVEVEAAFKEYHAERYAIAKEEYDASQGFTNILGKDYRAIITRAVLGWLPTSVWNCIIFQMSHSRPQASFLPLIEEKSTLELAPQPSLTKTLPILKKQAVEEKRHCEHTHHYHIGHHS
ncbi:hypothetical protein BGZ81_004526 [Podila clonocystis]|nr:hypothetical protein BGZ81_004526 [Podila clonocystis]